MNTFTGRTLQDFLIKEVDDQWQSKDGEFYYYYQTKDDKIVTFTLEVKPETQQKWNGVFMAAKLDKPKPTHEDLAKEKTFTERA